MNNALSIYLHIPFCTTKCTYCSFNAYVKLENLIPRFVTALCKEIAFLGRANPYPTVRTIFFGGGTPSLLSPEQLETILTQLQDNFNLSGQCEISMEANPDDLDRSYLRAIYQLGINRLSIGMQSAHAGELKLFARRHTQNGLLTAFSTAREAGFDNLSLDLMYGFPTQTMDTWQETLNIATHLKPQHISLYALGLEDHTPMDDWVRRGHHAMPEDDYIAAMYDYASDYLHTKGYSQYEISNWSKSGYECQHNMQYWLNQPYIGLGPGAHGYAGGHRYSTMLSAKQYVESFDDVQAYYPCEFPWTPAVTELHRVGRQAEIDDTIITTLRLTQRGIIFSEFLSRFRVSFLDMYKSQIDQLIGHNLVVLDDVSIKLTRKGRFLSNYVFRELLSS